MSKGFIFPGQGAQQVGMGKKLAENFVSAKRIFEEVDEALQESLSSLIWNGDIEKLTLTENAQPALMATSIAALAALEEEGFLVNNLMFMAGHSLGEYSALCAAKAISLADTAKLLRTRGQAMQNSVDPGVGSMAAILGLEIVLLRKVVEQASSDFSSDSKICQIANDNDPNQVVISGNSEVVDMVIELAKENGARRAIKLNVSAPFHCDLMKPAASVMYEALTETSIVSPEVPVVMNFTAREAENPNIIKDNLVSQVTGLVRWRETILYMISNGVSEFYELGVGKALSGMVRRVSNDVTTNGISSKEDIKEFLGG